MLLPRDLGRYLLTELTGASHGVEQLHQAGCGTTAQGSLLSSPNPHQSWKSCQGDFDLSSLGCSWWPGHQKNPSVQGEEASGLEGVVGSCDGNMEVLNQGEIMGQSQSTACQAWL